MITILNILNLLLLGGIVYLSNLNHRRAMNYLRQLRRLMLFEQHIKTIYPEIYDEAMNSVDKWIAVHDAEDLIK